MSKEYIITCESTADLTAASAKEAGIPVLHLVSLCEFMSFFTLYVARTVPKW